MVQLEIQIISKLRAQNAFEKIFSHAVSDQLSDLQIVVILVEMRDVDNFDRVMWGAMAGRAKTQARLEIRDRHKDKIVGISTIQGKSSGGSVFAGTTLESVDRVAEEVVRQILANK